MIAKKFRQWHEIYLDNYRNFFIKPDTPAEHTRTDNVVRHRSKCARELLKDLAKLERPFPYLRKLLLRLATCQRFFVAEKEDHELVHMVRTWYKQDLSRVSRELGKLSDQLVIAKRCSVPTKKPVKGKKNKQQYEKLSDWQHRLLHQAASTEETTTTTTEFSDLAVDFKVSCDSKQENDCIVRRQVVVLGYLTDRDTKKLVDYKPEQIANMRQHYAGLGHHFMPGYLMLHQAKLLKMEVVKTWKDAVHVNASKDFAVHKVSVRRGGFKYWLIYPTNTKLGSLNWGLV